MPLKALLHTDLQSDFFDGGALGAKGSEAIIPNENRLTRHADLRPESWLKVFSADKHPKGPFDDFPVHCVDGTPGSEFHPKILVPPTSILLHKGLNSGNGGFDPFAMRNVRLMLPIGGLRYVFDEYLGLFLRNLQVREVYVTGLVIEYCVKAAVLGSLGWGLKTYLVEDAAWALDTKNKQSVIDKLIKAGAHIINTDQVINEIR